MVYFVVPPPKVPGFWRFHQERDDNGSWRTQWILTVNGVDTREATFAEVAALPPWFPSTVRLNGDTGLVIEQRGDRPGPGPPQYMQLEPRERFDEWSFERARRRIEAAERQVAAERATTLPSRPAGVVINEVGVGHAAANATEDGRQEEQWFPRPPAERPQHYGDQGAGPSTAPAGGPAGGGDSTQQDNEDAEASNGTQKDQETEQSSQPDPTPTPSNPKRPRSGRAKPKATPAKRQKTTGKSTPKTPGNAKSKGKQRAAPEDDDSGSDESEEGSASEVEYSDEEAGRRRTTTTAAKMSANRKKYETLGTRLRFLRLFVGKKEAFFKLSNTLFWKGFWKEATKMGLPKVEKASRMVFGDGEERRNLATLRQISEYWVDGKYLTDCVSAPPDSMARNPSDEQRLMKTVHEMFLERKGIEERDQATAEAAALHEAEKQVITDRAMGQKLVLDESVNGVEAMLFNRSSMRSVKQAKMVHSAIDLEQKKVYEEINGVVADMQSAQDQQYQEFMRISRERSEAIERQTAVVNERETKRMEFEEARELRDLARTNRESEANERERNRAAREAAADERAAAYHALLMAKEEREARRAETAGGGGGSGDGGDALRARLDEHIAAQVARDEASRVQMQQLMALVGGVANAVDKLQNKKNSEKDG